MSRRDTIIVAVLVNAALLMILFATAVRTDEGKNESPKTQKIAKAPMIEKPVADDLLNQYITSVPTLAETQEDPNLFGEEIQLAFEPPQPIEEKINKENPHTQTRFVDVTVKKGDFLEKIAQANHTSVSAIMQANKLATTQLKIGQVLKVPVSEGTPKNPSQSSVQSEGGEYYIVKEGDNPWLIASRNHLHLDELLRLNGLDEQKARRLRPGDRLRIR